MNEMTDDEKCGPNTRANTTGSLKVHCTIDHKDGEWGLRELSACNKENHIIVVLYLWKTGRGIVLIYHFSELTSVSASI